MRIFKCPHRPGNRIDDDPSDQAAHGYVPKEVPRVKLLFDRDRYIFTLVRATFDRVVRRLEIAPTCLQVDSCRCLPFMNRLSLLV